MEQFDQHIIGPFSAQHEIVEFRVAVEQAGRDGFEIVGITATPSGNLYAAIKRPMRRLVKGHDGRLHPVQEG